MESAAACFPLRLGGKMVAEVRYDLQMSGGRSDSQLDEALLSVWKQALLERKRRVNLGEDSYAVRSTPKRGLVQVDFEFSGQHIRGLEQNPATSSRWAELARKGSKVMQFLIDGRYIAVVCDGKLTHFAGGSKK
jgi:hypothetical protein